jgi:membrane protease YdiL (CAAX protease family)
MRVRQFAVERPVAAAVVCAAAQFLLTVAILVVGRKLFAPHAFGAVKLTAFASTILFPVVLTFVLGLWRDVGVELRRVRPAPLFLVSLLSCAVFLALGVRAVEASRFLGDAGMQLANAFGEELLFRGVIFALLLRLPVGRAIVINGLLFGGMHLIHGVMDGAWGPALWQAAVTAAAGMMFTAVRYATGSLWLVVALHMLLNLAIIYSNIEPVAGPTALFVVERLVNLFELGLAAYVALRFIPRARRDELPTFA